MTSTGKPVPEYGSPASPKHAHLGTQAMLGLVLLLMATLVVVVAADRDSGTAAASRAALKLTPKADLPVIQAFEGQNWTHAPDVPPSIERAGQARIVVPWTANEFVSDLDPGKLRYAAWGFEGHTPGPMLRARVGDLIEIRLTNDVKSTHPHNIDFHFVNGPGGGATALNVSPGQTATVEVRALAPGIYMYHCATPDIPTHIANGMYGYVLIEPEEGLPKVDKELYVVQSEFYAKGAGIASLDTAKLDLEEPNFVVLNGAVGALLGDNSPKVKVGDTVRIWYGNAGPQLISSFHVIGEIFDRVYREGDLISPPALSVQTTLVPAGGATGVEFKIDVPGTYLMVDHAIARAVHKGAVGTIVAEGADDSEVFAPGTANPAPPAGGDGHGGGDAKVVTITDGAFDPKNAAKAFDPAVIEVAKGEEVKWMNADQVAHTATADDGSFDTGFIDPGTSGTVRFDKAGRFTYRCLPHPLMKGTVVVK